jgi:hypothetical protein
VLGGIEHHSIDSAYGILPAIQSFPALGVLLGAHYCLAVVL